MAERKGLRSNKDAEIEEFSTPAKTAVEASATRNTYSRQNHKSLLKVLDAIERLVKENESLHAKFSDLEQKVLSCNCRKEPIDNNKEEIAQIHKLLSLEKQNRKFEDQCKNIKNRMAVFWSRSLSQRKKSFWHHCMNSSKANMYIKWIDDYPEYIPLKFKPKHIAHENDEARTHRVNEARRQYHSSVDLHKTYAASHEEKFKAIDATVITHIESVTAQPEERRILKEWWTDDTARCEHQSFQIWEKKENFFNRKRTEDIENDRSVFSKQTWAEITNTRKTTPRNQNQNNPRQNNNDREKTGNHTRPQQHRRYNSGNYTAINRTRSPSPQFARQQNRPQTRPNNRSPIRNIPPEPAPYHEQWFHDDYNYNRPNSNLGSPRFPRNQHPVNSPFVEQPSPPPTRYVSIPSQPNTNFPWHPVQRVWM